MLIEELGWFVIGCGSALMVIGIGYLMERYFGHKESHALKKSQSQKKEREISEFSFRDRSGKFSTVKIIVDGNIELADNDKVEEMVFKGDGGRLGDLVDGAPDPKDVMNVKDFVFSPKAVRDIRASGVEPEDVVIQILKAAGRM